ncbi:hypothetical protein QBC36DRAFT_307748 [Triangularia setosa]|uniref:Uncharacterized protein n=1 Tax=Triangularia setosa TaxID=2587417 RepID=A0AAN6WDC6_9PEZI|nr:hypothetical protein QBC36DRAFT_307748 [Podospora setosa]
MDEQDEKSETAGPKLLCVPEHKSQQRHSDMRDDLKMKEPTNLLRQNVQGLREEREERSRPVVAFKSQSSLNCAETNQGPYYQSNRSDRIHQIQDQYPEKAASRRSGICNRLTPKAIGIDEYESTLDSARGAKQEQTGSFALTVWCQRSNHGPRAPPGWYQPCSHIIEAQASLHNQPRLLWVIIEARAVPASAGPTYPRALIGKQLREIEWFLLAYALKNERKSTSTRLAPWSLTYKAIRDL